MHAWRSILICVGLIGCDRTPAPAPVPPAATTLPVADAPATRPAKPAKAIFFVDEQPLDFPPAKIVFEPRDGDLRVVVLSEDPPTAVRDGQVGNSFYFDLLLEKTTEADADGASFVFPESVGEGRDDRGDATTGLFVSNGRQTLTPAGAKIGFEKEGDAWTVRVSGTFRLFDSRTPDGKPQVVTVNALLSPKVIVKDKK